MSFCRGYWGCLRASSSSSRLPSGSSPWTLALLPLPRHRHPLPPPPLPRLPHPCPPWSPPPNCWRPVCTSANTR
ncbi:hypothetical protein DKP78_16160, partial [Enterococcus faecium]